MWVAQIKGSTLLDDCSRWLTWSPVDFNSKLWLRLSLVESVLPFGMLECDSVEIEGALPVDCTPTIKSRQGL